MAPALSSNWKALQDKIKAESTAKPAEQKKRPAPSTVTSDASRKRQKVHETTTAKSRPVKPASKPSRSLKAAPMGNTQSSKIDPVPATGVAPSLALWAQDNDLSPEDLAEAYGLGLSQKAMAANGPDRINEGFTPGAQLGKYLAVDCEMVGVGEGGHDDALARVSVVDFHGRQVYDSFVKPEARVTDWRTHVSGVTARHMRTARPFDEVQSAVAEMLRGRILVGHDVKHDLAALQLEHPFPKLRDTAKFSGFKKYGNGPKPALRVLARELLGVEIQSGEHSSIEDARVAMLLFRKHKPAFDVEHANRYPDPSNTKSRPQQKKKKRKQ